MAKVRRRLDSLKRGYRGLQFGSHFLLSSKSPPKPNAVEPIFEAPPKGSKSGIVDMHSSFTCDICKKVYSRKDTITRHHVLGCGVEKKYPCPKCGRNYMVESTLRRHIRKECGVNKKFFCNKCMFTCKLESQLQHHMETKHKEVKGKKQFKVEEEFESSKGLFKCEKCEKVYLRYDSLKKHEKECGKEPDLFCKLCSYATVRPSNLRAHMQTKHDPNKRLFQCPKCNKLLTTKYAYDCHVNDVCNKEASFKCKLCTYSAKVKSSLVNHIKSSHDVKEYPNFEEDGLGRESPKYKCQSCCKSFPTKRGYLYHIQLVCKEKKEKSSDLRSYFKKGKTGSEDDVTMEVSENTEEQKIETIEKEQKTIVDNKSKLSKDDDKLEEFQSATSESQLKAVENLELHNYNSFEKNLIKTNNTNETVSTPKVMTSAAGNQNNPASEKRKKRRTRCIKMIAMVPRTERDSRDECDKKNSTFDCNYCSFSCNSAFHLHDHVSLNHKIRNVYKKEFRN